MAHRKPRRPPADLPQRDDIWGVACRRLRIWITPPNETPYRPFIILVVNLSQGTIQSSEITDDSPEEETILAHLLQAIQKPPKELRQKPYRPQQIQIEDAGNGLTASLRPPLEEIGVTVEAHARLPIVDEIVQELEEHLRGGPENPGLLSVKDMTPALVGGMFAAAAEFYRAEPWVHLTDTQTLAVRVAPEQEPRFVQVMGGGGVEYGLAMYRRWEDVERLFSFADHPLEMLPPEGGHSFIFENISSAPIADVEAIEQYNWETADEQAYPIPIIYTREGQAKRPGPADLQWYEAALRAIPLFVDKYLQADRYDVDNPLEFTFSVPTHAGQTEVDVKYPAGVLPVETRPVGMAEWPASDDEDLDEVFTVDRRAMEGMMDQLGMGFDNSELQQAQELMYQAWEEPNPIRRLILAREALSISPDCADAYVLLAEEEADTVGRALEYYQKGVEAGERALGSKFFKENAGYFWGILETRPYMRARQGLAATLWEMNRIEEAAPHYWEMLRLNPNDNQGVRYSLLNLLLSLNRDDEARRLLKEYEEDGMAEWLYTRALLTFRETGPGKAANNALREAVRLNPHVPTYLTGRKRIPGRLPDFMGWGDENEAVIYASAYLSIWRKTPDAVDWLKSQAKPARRDRSSSKKRRGRRRN